MTNETDLYLFIDFGTDILPGTNLFEVVFHIYHFIYELFNLRYYWWRDYDAGNTVYNSQCLC